MSKELTEQWKSGELKAGWYFLEFENGSILPVYYCGFNREFEFSWDWKISEVLVQADYNQFADLSKKVEKLEKQLKEAESVIRLYLMEEPPLNSPPWKKYNHAVAKRYIEKYGVEK